MVLSPLTMISRVGERSVPPWMTVTEPALRSAKPVLDAVATEVSVKRVAESILATVAPEGMPVPVTRAPTVRPAVLVTSTVGEPRVVTPAARAVTVVAEEAVCRMPPEMIFRMPPSGIETMDEPAALKRRVIGETTLSSEPA